MFVFFTAFISDDFQDTSLSHYDVNVLGSTYCCMLAKRANAAFHHTSTIGVGGAVSVNSKPLTFSEECPPQREVAGSFSDNVYIKSKREAEEALLQNEELKSVNKRIYRIGNVTWNANGVFQINPFENGFIQRIKGFVSLNAFPASSAFAPIEFTSVFLSFFLFWHTPRCLLLFDNYSSTSFQVEQCAEAYSLLVLHQHEIPASQRVFHIMNHRTVTLSNVASIIAPTSRCIPDAEFASLANANVDKSGVAVQMFYRRRAGVKARGIILARNSRTAQTLRAISGGNFEWRFPNDAEIAHFCEITKDL